MEQLLVITNIILFCILLFSLVMVTLLYKYVTVFNKIYLNTEELKSNLITLNQVMTNREREMLLQSFDKS